MAASDAPVFKKEREHAEGGWVNLVNISPDGTLVASTVGGGKIFLLEISSGMRLYTFVNAPPATLRGVCWARDGMRFWAADENGSVIEVSRSTRVGKWSHKSVYKHTCTIIRLTYVPVFNLLALVCYDSCLVLVDIKTYKAIQSIALGAAAFSVACNASGSLLFVGFYDGRLRAFSRNESGAYDKVDEVKAHKDTITALSQSASGSLLLAGSLDQTASLWRIASPFSSFDASPLMTFKGHTGAVVGAAFSGDEHFALTASRHMTIRMWRVADGAEVDCLSFHAASGALAASVYNYGVVIFRCAPHTPVIPSIDRRKRRPLAAAELRIVQGRIAEIDEPVRATAQKEGELLAAIARHKDCVASAEKELALLRSTDYVMKRDELALLYSEKEALLNEISVHDHVLHELDENIKMPKCLGSLHSEGFQQWLHDIGLAHTIEHLKELDGGQLKTFLVLDVEGMGLSFADSSSLLLRAYMTHHRASPAPHFAPPPGLLSWDAATTSSWLTSHGYGQLASLELNGPCLCSLNYPRVQTMMDTAAFNELSARIQDQLASEGAPQWAQHWTGLSTISTLKS